MDEKGSRGVLSLSLCGSSVKEPGGRAPLLETLKDTLKSLWRRAALSIGAPFWGNWRRAHLPGTLRDG